MKVTVPLLVIAFASAKAGAFQAKIDPLKLALKPANALASTDQALAIAEAHARLAAAVSGCQCPFCTQMRLVNTGL